MLRVSHVSRDEAKRRYALRDEAKRRYACELLDISVKEDHGSNSFVKVDDAVLWEVDDVCNINGRRGELLKRKEWLVSIVDYLKKIPVEREILLYEVLFED